MSEEKKVGGEEVEMKVDDVDVEVMMNEGTEDGFEGIVGSPSRWDGDSLVVRVR